MQHTDVLLEKRLGALGTRFYDIADLLIDDAGRGIAERLRVAHVAAKEHLMIWRAVLQRTKLLRHTPVADHLASKIRRTLDIVACTGRDAVEDDTLSSTTTKQ